MPRVVDAKPASGSIPTCKSRNYFIPGVVVNIIMLVTLSLTAMAIVREKEIGTMEQLMVTPHPSGGADPRQDAAVRAGRLIGIWCWWWARRCCCSTFPSTATFVPASVRGGVFLRPDHAGRGLVHLHHFTNPAAGQ